MEAQMTEANPTYGRYLDEFRRLSRPLDPYARDTLTGKVLERDQFGGRYLTPNAEVMGRYFRAGNQGVAGAQEFLTAIRGDAEAMQAMRMYIADQISMRGRQGVGASQLQTFIRQHENALRTLGLLDDLKTVEKAGQFVTEAAEARALQAKAAEQQAKTVETTGVDTLARAQKTALGRFLKQDPDKAISNMISSCYGCAGERCLAGSVVVGLGEAHDAVRKKFTEAASKLKVGYGLDETVQMGPVITKKHQERVKGYIDTGEKEGAQVALDGRRIEVSGYEHGYFVGPTVLDRVTPDMTVAKEEIFGPVASVFEMNDLDEAIEWINKSPYGNAASIYTSSGKAARDFRYRAKAGSIGINVGIAAAMAYFPFGGMKNSFFGDLHPQGRDAIRFFTESKVVITRWV